MELPGDRLQRTVQEVGLGKFWVLEEPLLLTHRFRFRWRVRRPGNDISCSPSTEGIRACASCLRKAEQRTLRLELSLPVVSRGSGVGRSSGWHGTAL